MALQWHNWLESSPPAVTHGAVHDDRPSKCLGHGCNLANCENTARRNAIRLQDLITVVHQGFAETVQPTETFPAGYGDIDLPMQSCGGQEVVPMKGFLQPVGSLFLQRATLKPVS
jgi:hypothetical protein